MSKKILAALLAVCMIAGLLFVPASAATFDDVDGHWAADAIERWAGYGVLEGHGDGTFTPDKVMTRAEFAAMLVKMLGLTAKSDKTFGDVSADAWYAEVVSIAVKAGIINGRTADKFAPNDPVTFEEAAVMMCRAFGLAKVTSGADWSKESIDKLTELGMIGEGADEHLQVGVDCNRAVVAALADSVVAEYVAEDREEPITGEVKGVVLVVKGAKAEIKDATVAAPIVAESSSVTLTNTKADNVIVSGKDAAITADEASSVADVTLGGEAPKADIKGEVGSVTITEETTGAVVDAPKAAEDAIVNNSANDATVNGETMKGEGSETETKPAPTPDTGDEDEGDNNQGGGTTAPENPKPEGDHVHSYTSVVTKAATCKEEGVKTYTCANTDKKCQKVEYTEVIPKTEHNWGTTEEDGTGANNGQKVYKCQTDGCCAEKLVSHTCPTESEITADNTTVTTVAATCAAKGSKTTYCKVCQAVLKTEELPVSETHGEKETLAAVLATCTKKGLTVGERCKVCGKVTTEQTATDVVAENHVVENAKTWQSNAEKHWNVCTENAAHHANEADHTWDAESGTCSVCEYECTHRGTTNQETCSICGKTLTTTPAHTHDNWDSKLTAGDTTHWYACKEADCDAKKDEAAHTAKENISDWTKKDGAQTPTWEKLCSCGKVMDTTTECPETKNHTHGVKCTECGVTPEHTWGTEKDENGNVSCDCGAKKAENRTITPAPTT